MNSLCELLYGGWGVSRTLVHQFAGSGAALEMLPLLRSYRYLCYNTIVSTCMSRGGLRAIVLWNTTFSDGCLGSNNDEGRSEV